MKTLSKSIIVQAGDLTVSVTLDTSGMPFSIDDVERDGGFPNPWVSPEVVERLAGIIRELRDASRDYTPLDVCVDHGYYDRVASNYLCPACTARDALLDAEADEATP